MAKGDWTYIESEELKQTVAFDKNSGWLFCKDGTKYSPKELEKITKDWKEAIELPSEVHIIKKMFSGTIVSAGNK